MFENIPGFIMSLTRERDEARAERDALAVQLAEVDAAVGDPEHPRFGQPEVRARMHAIVKAATANEDERDRILARHDVEVKAQALDEAAAGWTDRLARQMHARDYMNDRAAAIREEAK